MLRVFNRPPAAAQSRTAGPALAVFVAAAVVLLFVLRAGPDAGAGSGGRSPMRGLTGGFGASSAAFAGGSGDGDDGLGSASSSLVLLTYLFKPAPSRPLHTACAAQAAVPPGRKLQLPEYTRLLALRACCTGTPLLLVTEDETVGLEGLLALKGCLGLPAAVWSVPPPWEEVTAAVAGAQAEHDAAAAQAPGGGGSVDLAAPTARDALIVAMVVSNPSVMLPWSADLQAAVRASAAAALTRGGGGAGGSGRQLFGARTAGDTDGNNGAGSASSSPPLSVEVFMAGHTPYGYEAAAATAAAALFEPLNWLGYDVSALSHPVGDDERGDAAEDAGGAGGDADGVEVGGDGGEVETDDAAAGGPAPVRGRLLAAAPGRPVAPSSTAGPTRKPGAAPVAAAAARPPPRNATAAALAAADPSAVLQFAAAEGRLPVSPFWLDWVSLRPQKWFGIHPGPGFVREVVATLAARPASLEPPHVVWGGWTPPAAAAAGGGGGQRGPRRLQQQPPQQQQGAAAKQPVLRVDGALLKPGGTAARAAWLLWAAPSAAVAASLRPPATPWGMQTLAYSTWRKAVVPNTVLLRNDGAFFKRAGGVEAEVQHILASIAAQACGSGSPAVLVDIGANAGYFAYLGALQGCTVLAVEPQQPCRQLLQFTREHNPSTIGRNVRPYPFGVSSEPLSFDSSWDGNCLGGYQVDEVAQRSAAAAALYAAGATGVGVAAADAPAGAGVVNVAAELRKTHTRSGDELITAALSSLSTVLPPGVVPSLVALKVDVEGHEVHVLKSLARTLRSAQLFHIVLEVAPRKWPLALKASEALRVLADLLDTYTALLLPDIEYPPETAKWPTRSVFGRTYPRVPGKGALKALLRNRIERGRGTNLYFALRIYDGASEGGGGSGG